jgi:hypothetical protein
MFRAIKKSRIQPLLLRDQLHHGNNFSKQCTLQIRPLSICGGCPALSVSESGVVPIFIVMVEVDFLHVKNFDARVVVVFDSFVSQQGTRQDCASVQLRNRRLLHFQQVSFLIKKTSNKKK